MIIDGSCPVIEEKKASFWDKHPALSGPGTIVLGFGAVAAIDRLFYLIGGLPLVERMRIVPICVGALFFIKGFFMSQIKKAGKQPRQPISTAAQLADVQPSVAPAADDAIPEYYCCDNPHPFDDGRVTVCGCCGERW